MIKLRISREGDHFLVDDPSLCGTPPVGRGQTMMEAIGEWVHYNRDRIGVDFVVDKSAESAERERRRRALAQR